MITLTTPTGTIGSKLLQIVLATGSMPLRVIARDPSRLPEDVAARVEIITGSMDDPATLSHAFSGASAVFWCQPDTFGAEDYVAAYESLAGKAADAIRDAGVPRVVAISAAGETPDKPAGPISALHRIEAVLAPSGAACRFLRCGSFFENLLWQWDKIVDAGFFTYPMDGDVAGPQVATADIATVAAEWLVRPDWTGVSPLQVLGPEDLSYQTMAEILMLELRRRVRYERAEPEAYREALLAQGFSASAAQGHFDMFAFVENGYRVDPATPRAETPTTFAAWLNREAD